MNKIFVGLGSNMGESDGILDRALEEISNLNETRLIRASRRFLTQPQGDNDQPWFINQVVEIESQMEPLILLAGLQEIEEKMGRIRDSSRRNGPRTLDLDILLYGDERMDLPELKIPHPRISERAFVLVPLAELVPNLMLGNGENIQNALGKLNFRLEKDKIYQE